MANSYGKVDLLESPFQVEIVKDCILMNTITGDNIIPEIGTKCEVSTASWRINGTDAPTCYSFHKLDVDGSESYLGTLNEFDFSEVIEKGIIVRL